MTVEHRTLTIRLNDTVFAKLIDRAREQGRTPTRYAQELFDAAWAARCGKDTGDAELERAVRQTPAPATGPDPRDARIATLEVERDALQLKLATAGKTIDGWEKKATEFNGRIDGLTASLADAEAEIAKLREQLAKPVEPVAVAQPEPAPEPEPQPAPEPEPQSKPAPAPQLTRAPELAGCTIRMIRALRATGMTPGEIARETDTSILDVRRVLERKAS